MLSFGFIISLRITFKTDGKFYKSYIYIYVLVKKRQGIIMKLHKGNKNMLAAETEKLTALTFKIN